MAAGARDTGASPPEGPGVAGLEYTVRASANARHVRLVVSARDGLVVVVPLRFDRRGIPDILERKARWIERAAARVGNGRPAGEIAPARLPDRIALVSVGEEWAVEYRSGPPPASGVRIREQAGRRLLLSGDVGDVAACWEALGRWLRRKAGKVIVPKLLEMADEHGFEVGRVSVRRQRTRWASCSRRKTISLNVKLLFLPPEIVEYVLLHELCHTVRMDHSAAFWALIRGYDPACKAKNRLLRESWKSLPAWVAGDGIRRVLD